jgi:hypothetical protein
MALTLIIDLADRILGEIGFLSRGRERNDERGALCSQHKPNRKKEDEAVDSKELEECPEQVGHNV